MRKIFNIPMHADTSTEQIREPHSNRSLVMASHSLQATGYQLL